MMNKELLVDIEKNISLCKKCRLHSLAKNPVPGEGNSMAEIMFIGEAPGATEDETGRPFVGRAGNLLAALLEKIGLKRADVWIGNIIKHRPPENRDPLPDEIIACSPYLAMQIKIINPKLIVTLGRHAMNYFYPDGKISRDRGHLITVGGRNIYPVYHPAAGLRNPTMLADLKSDFINIPKVLENINNFNQESAKPSSNDGQMSLF